MCQTQSLFFATKISNIQLEVYELLNLTISFTFLQNISLKRYVINYESVSIIRGYILLQTGVFKKRIICLKDVNRIGGRGAVARGSEVQRYRMQIKRSCLPGRHAIEIVLEGRNVTITEKVEVK